MRYSSLTTARWFSRFSAVTLSHRMRSASRYNASSSSPRGQGLEVVGAIRGGRSVEGAAALGDQGEVLAALHVLAALEHHVFEQVCEAAWTGALVPRADVVGDADRDRRRARVLIQHHAQAVLERHPLDRQGQALERHHGGVLRRRGGRRRPELLERRRELHLRSGQRPARASRVHTAHGSNVRRTWSCIFERIWR